MDISVGTGDEVNPLSHFYQIYRISARRARNFFATAQLSACCTEPVVRVVSVVVKKTHPVVFSIFNSQFSIQVQYFPNPAVINTHRSEVRLQ